MLADNPGSNFFEETSGFPHYRGGAATLLQIFHS